MILFWCPFISMWCIVWYRCRPIGTTDCKLNISIPEQIKLSIFLFFWCQISITIELSVNCLPVVLHFSHSILEHLFACFHFQVRLSRHTKAPLCAQADKFIVVLEIYESNTLNLQKFIVLQFREVCIVPYCDLLDLLCLAHHVIVTVESLNSAWSLIFTHVALVCNIQISIITFESHRFTSKL